MKNHIYILLLLFFTHYEVRSQVLSNENFIYSETPQRAVKSTNYSSLPATDKHKSVTYFDGLGRPMQTIAIGQGGNGEDIITPITYDGFGRQDKDYLPYTAASSGLYRTDALVGVGNFYSTEKYENTANPFSQKEFEASPLNRVLQQAAPGNAWSLSNNHTIKMDYQTNIASEVKLFTVTTAFTSGLYNPTLSQPKFYDPGQLYKNITKDENWTIADGKNKTTEEFKDKEGRVVLKRTYSNYVNTLGSITASEVAHDTYYVYDGYGNLTYVIPPLANGAYDASTLDNLCYQYKYDYRNRLVEKKLPGKGWESIVYDKLDRVVLTQDANLKAQNKWLFTKYDVFNRPVYTGEFISASSRETLQSQVSGGTILSEKRQGVTPIGDSSAYYSNLAFPNASITLYTINYYDDYSFDLAGGVSETAGGVTPTSNVKGLPTGSRIRTLGTTLWTTNVQYYDTKGRQIYGYSKNDYLGTIDKIKSTLDFTGKATQTETRHKKGNSAELVLLDSYEYDHTGRLLTQKQAINGSTQEIIAANKYDSLGQLESKGVGGKTTQNRLQTVDYKYNIRGWLKSINDVNTLGNDLFSFAINYNMPTDASKALYNGNISQTFWKTANLDTSLKNYLYSYDALNRLTNATDNLNKFNETIAYDLNGNIKNLTRLGEIVGGSTVPNISVASHFGVMDNLKYTYDAGNRLQIVSDSANDTYGFKDDLVGATDDTTTDYTYDANGNMKTDNNKAITDIMYNHLNLPTQVTISSKKINYTYDATGKKLRKVVESTSTSPTTTTNYAGGFQYQIVGTAAEALQFVPTAEGYVEHNSGNYSYVYQYKDHLGNVRLAYKDSNNNGAVNNTEILSEDNYYPFGLKHKGYNSNVVNSNNKYKYNGKELQDELGLNMYDYGARNYDPALGRWMNIDPLSEKMPSWSPYSFCFNNPILFIDPDGAYPIITITSQPTGQYATQKIIGAYSLPNNSYYSIRVPLYNAVITDTEDKNFRQEFMVTRDAWAVMPEDRNDGGNSLELTNIAFEPKGDNVYDATVQNSYPHDNDTGALRLSQDGSEKLDSQSRKNLKGKEVDSSTNVLLHVGAIYKNDEENVVRAGGSESCFGIVNKNNSKSNPSDNQTNKIINIIQAQADKSKTNPGQIQVIINNRTNVQRNKEVDIK